MFRNCTGIDQCCSALPKACPSCSKFVEGFFRACSGLCQFVPISFLGRFKVLLRLAQGLSRVAGWLFKTIQHLFRTVQSCSTFAQGVFLGTHNCPRLTRPTQGCSGFLKVCSEFLQVRPRTVEPCVDFTNIKSIPKTHALWPAGPPIGELARRRAG